MMMMMMMGGTNNAEPFHTPALRVQKKTMASRGLAYRERSLAWLST